MTSGPIYLVLVHERVQCRVVVVKARPSNSVTVDSFWYGLILPFMSINKVEKTISLRLNFLVPVFRIHLGREIDGL